MNNLDAFFHTSDPQVFAISQLRSRPLISSWSFVAIFSRGAARCLAFRIITMGKRLDFFLLYIALGLIRRAAAAPYGFGPYSSYERRPSYSSSYSGGSYKERDPYPVLRVVPLVREVDVVVQHRQQVPIDIVSECLLCNHEPDFQEDSMDIVIPLPRPRKTFQVDIDASFSSNTQSESFPAL